MSKDYILYQQMRTALAQWVELAEPEWQLLASIFKVRRVEKRATILLPGARAHELFFVCRGLLRFYYLAENGRESNKAFVAENLFAGPLAPAALALPFLYGVQALEPTILLVAQYREFVALFEKHPLFERLGRKLAEALLMRKDLRARSLLQQQADERYLGFLNQYAHLIHRLPQYHIASYLGISEVSLSRLKRKLDS